VKIMKRMFLCAVALAFVAGICLTAMSTTADEGSWTGYVTDSLCAKGGDMAKMKDSDCATMCVKDHGGKWVLYSPTAKKAFTLEPADKVAEHAGHYVTIKGNLDGDNIKVSSVTMIKEPGAGK
jgi:hypothetical protein